MKILFIGDIFGKKGREIVSKHLSSLKREYSVDLVIANGEKPEIIYDIINGEDVGTMFVGKL